MTRPVASRRFVIVAVRVALVCIAAQLCCYAQVEKTVPRKVNKQPARDALEGPKITPPSGAGFYIAPIQDAPGQFSLLFSDSYNRTVAGSFSMDQVLILEAILAEAKKFALTDEAVGLKKPVTTRFFDKNDPAFVVDVAKLGNRSQFVVTIKCVTGEMTMDAGSIKRGDEKVAPLFYDIAARVRLALENQ